MANDAEERLNAYLTSKARALCHISDEEYLENLKNGTLLYSTLDMSPRVYTLYAKPLLMQYCSEYWGAYQYEEAYKRGLAPTHLSQKMFENMYLEEYGHARLVWLGDGKGNQGPLALMDIDPTLFLAASPVEQINLLNIFKHPGFKRWSEIIVYNHLQDRSAKIQLDDFARGRFEPWTKVLRIIDAEEQDHIRHGEEWLVKLAENAEGRAMLQEDVNRWFPHAMDVFGHPGGGSRTEAELLRFGIKRKTNDQARQDFVNATRPLLERCGVKLPAWEYRRNRPFA